MESQLTIVIPSKNRISILQESLAHLMKAIENFKVEVILVNDGDNEINSLKQIYSSVQIVKNKGKGVASARNTGAAFAKSEVLLFMDDDIWMTETAIKRILKFHDENQYAAFNLNWIYPRHLQESLSRLVLGRYLEKNQFTTLKGWNKDLGDWMDNVCFQTSLITSQNLSFRTETFLKTGGYNESFPHAGFEDYEFSKRLVSNGTRIVVDPTVITFHNEADRLAITPWLDRKERGGETRGVAVSLGFYELHLTYTLSKTLVLSIVYLFQPLLKILAINKITNAFKALDLFSFRIIDALFAAAIHRGYTRKPKKN